MGEEAYAKRSNFKVFRKLETKAERAAREEREAREEHERFMSHGGRVRASKRMQSKDSDDMSKTGSIELSNTTGSKQLHNSGQSWYQSSVAPGDTYPPPKHKSSNNSKEK